MQLAVGGVAYYPTQMRQWVLSSGVGLDGSVEVSDQTAAVASIGRGSLFGKRVEGNARDEYLTGSLCGRALISLGQFWATAHQTLRM